MYATDTASSTQTDSRKGQPNHSIEFKLKLAQRACEAGISVSSLALGCRNYVFAGADSGGQRAAAMYTLIGTTRFNGVDPQAYLRHVLTHIATHSRRSSTPNASRYWSMNAFTT